MTKDEEQMIANLMHRMHANEQARLDAALSSARADAVTRAEADRKRIEALTEELRMDRDELAETEEVLKKANENVSGLLTQVRDMREEIIRVNDAHGRTIVERDALRAEVAELKTQLERLTSWAAKNQAARETLQTEIERLKAPPKRSEPVPKRAHPVAVGGYLRRLTGFNTTPAGEVARVTLVDDDDPSQLEYEVVRPNGQKGRWSAKGCEPCDPSATHDTPEGRSVAESVIRDDRNTEPKPGDTVRLMRTPTHRDYPATWEGRWGLVGREAVVVNMSSRGASRLVGVTFADGRFCEWPVSCVEVVRTEPDEIKVGDVVEVFQSTASCTFKTDIGTRGTVLQLDDSCVDTAPLDGFLAPKCNHVALCDVRKVTT